jgi:hypothetical protein
VIEFFRDADMRAPKHKERGGRSSNKQFRARRRELKALDIKGDQ